MVLFIHCNTDLSSNHRIFYSKFCGIIILVWIFEFIHVDSELENMNLMIADIWHAGILNIRRNMHIDETFYRMSTCWSVAKVHQCIHLFIHWSDYCVLKANLWIDLFIIVDWDWCLTCTYSFQIDLFKSVSFVARRASDNCSIPIQ